MSSDNEITAMKASGISLWQIISPGLVLSVLLSGICLWLTTTVSPRFRYRAEMLKRTEAVKNPLALLEPGGFTGDLPGYSIRIGRREGDELYDIHIYVLGDRDSKLQQDVTARRGHIHINEEERVIELTLEDATFANVNLSGDGDSETRVSRVATKEFVFPLSYGSEMDKRPLSRRLKYLDLPMLFARIYVDSEAGRDTTPHYVELNMRLSMALSPLAFLLIGIPFGIRSRRSETSVGLLLSVFLALGFYAFVMLSDSLERQPHLHPELLVWLPNIIYQAGGLWALTVIGRH
jgi:lipopolysaccharide export LptBFGC system permease protein LptF